MSCKSREAGKTENRRWTKEEILDAIRMYVNGNGYLPNFNTFLNNLPCEEPPIEESKEQKTLWQ